MKTLKNYIPIVIYIWLLLALALPNVILAHTEKMSWLGASVNILLPLGITGLLASISPKIGRTVWWFLPLMVLGAFQIVLIALYGRSVIAVDMFLNCVTTSSAEVGELLGSLLPAIGLVCAIYLPVLLFTIPALSANMTLSPRFFTESRKFSAGMLASGIVALVLCYSSADAFAIHRDLYPVNAGYNIYLAVDRTVRTGNYHLTSDNYKYNAVATHSDPVPEIAVLVIGETSRADNWELLGYKRHTNPHLKRRAEKLFIAPRAYSESNTTHKSVPMLLSPLNSENFENNIYNVKSLISAFREAGWHTAFVSNQTRNRSFIDFFSNEADTTIYVDRGEGDFNLFPVFDRLVRHRAPRQLIVIHTYGSHFNYRDRYTAYDAHFLPDDYQEATLKNKDKLVNAYDNTIVATDRFLDLLIRRLDHEHCRTSLLYASDHGEDIFDDGRSFLHASPMPSENQVHVPMIAWLSDQYIDRYPAVARNLKNNFRKLISTSRSFCPTALSLAGITTDKVESAACLTLSSYKSRTPLYLNDHNKPVYLSTIL